MWDTRAFVMAADCSWQPLARALGLTPPAGPRPWLCPAAGHLVIPASAAQHEPLRNAFVSAEAWTSRATQVQNPQDGSLHRLTLGPARCQASLGKQLGQPAAG